MCFGPMFCYWRMFTELHVYLFAAVVLINFTTHLIHSICRLGELIKIRHLCKVWAHLQAFWLYSHAHYR